MREWDFLACSTFVLTVFGVVCALYWVDLDDRLGVFGISEAKGGIWEAGWWGGERVLV